MAENRCVCCGEIIPEGMMVCPNCQVSQKKKKKYNYANEVYLEIKAYSPYVDGIVGQDIKLTFKQKIKILFCDGISVYLGNVFKKDGTEDGKL